jgi:hypothetical protein
MAMTKNTTLDNAYAGNIGFDIAYGSFVQSQLYYVPVALMAGVGALIAGLLIFKKRKPFD